MIASRRATCANSSCGAVIVNSSTRDGRPVPMRPARSSLANRDPSLVGVRVARMQPRRCGHPVSHRSRRDTSRGRVRRPQRAHRTQRRPRSGEVPPSPRTSSVPRGCRCACSGGAVSARLDPGLVETAAGRGAHRFDGGLIAAADLAQAAGGAAGAPFPIQGDIAATITDADDHTAHPGSRPVPVRIAAAASGRAAACPRETELSAVGHPIPPPSSRQKVWVAEVQGGMEQAIIVSQGCRCCRRAHLRHPGRPFANSSASRQCVGVA